MTRLVGLRRGIAALAMWATGPALAQVPQAAEVVQACGGYRLTVAAEDGALGADEARHVAEVLLSRLPSRAGPLSAMLDTVDAADDGTVIVSRAGAGDLGVSVDAFLASGSPLSVFIEANTAQIATGEYADFDDPAGGASLRLHVPPVAPALGIEDARVEEGEGGPVVSVDLDDAATLLFAKITRASVGRRLALATGNRVLTVPTIQSEIPGGRLQISGNFDMAEAEDLAGILRSGVLGRRLVVIDETLLPPGGGLDGICSALGP